MSSAQNMISSAHPIEDKTTLIDSRGFRFNVGIVLCNRRGRLFWAKRIASDGWQFPQGGMHKTETPRQAMFRELYEEIGLEPDQVEVLQATQHWLYYTLPSRYLRQRPTCIGQRQKWYLLRLQASESHVQFDKTSKPEFGDYKWVDYWHPLDSVVYFKQGVYHQVLNEFSSAVEKLRWKSEKRKTYFKKQHARENHNSN